MNQTRSMTTIRLEDILVFVAGADCVPPMGFKAAPVQFEFVDFSGCETACMTSSGVNSAFSGIPST